MERSRQPHTLVFLPSGLAAVLDDDGRQLPDFQGTHLEVLRKLRLAQIEIETLEVIGRPRAT